MGRKKHNTFRTQSTHCPTAEFTWNRSRLLRTPSRRSHTPCLPWSSKRNAHKGCIEHTNVPGFTSYRMRNASPLSLHICAQGVQYDVLTLDYALPIIWPMQTQFDFISSGPHTLKSYNFLDDGLMDGWTLIHLTVAVYCRQMPHDCRPKRYSKVKRPESPFFVDTAYTRFYIIAQSPASLFGINWLAVRVHTHHRRRFCVWVCCSFCRNSHVVSTHTYIPWLGD